MPPVSLNSSNIHASHVEVVCNFAAGEVGHWYHLRKPCEVDAETLWRPTIVGFLAKIDIPSHSQRPPSPGETPWFVPAMTWNVRMNGGGVQLKTAPQERLKAKRENKKDSKLWASKMGSWNSQIFKWVLMMFIYFYNVQNGMLHWVGLLCFYYRSAHGERVGCDRTTWLRRKNHRGSTQNNLNESTCLLDVSIFSSLKDFRKVAKCSEEISSKCGPHVVAEHQLGFVPLAAQDFQPKVSFCWLQKISMPTLFGVEFEPVFLRFCFKKGPHRRLLLSLKKSEIASFT